MKDKRMCLNCCEIINHEGDVINHVCNNLNIGKVSDIPCYRYVDGVGAVYACATTCAGLPNCGRRPKPTNDEIIWELGGEGLPDESGFYICKTVEVGDMYGMDIEKAFFWKQSGEWEGIDGKGVVRWWHVDLFK